MASTHTLVQFYFRAENVRNPRGLTKPNTCCRLFQDLPGSPNKLLGETEVIQAENSPVFQQQLETKYVFETRQPMRVQLWDYTNRKEPTVVHTFSFTLAELMSTKKGTITSAMEKQGTLTVSAARIGSTKGRVTLTLRAHDLKKMSTFSKTSPYFEISRLLMSGQKKVLYRSKAVEKTLTPQWGSTHPIDLTDLCGGDAVSKSVAIDVYHADGSTAKPMGGIVLRTEELIAADGKDFELTRRDEKGKTKSFGFLTIGKCEYEKAYDFLEYLQAGMEINVAFSIDFTSSNGLASDPRSLHYYNTRSPNHYVRAMLAVSDVVQQYDSDQQFPVFGFGAIAPFTNGVSHFFPLNGNVSNAYVTGMQTVVDTYAALLPTLKFSGPTNFAPTIKTMTDGARQARGVYTILMILTDGAITDMQDTIDAIVEADDAPLSIIIIGIGNEDFSSMERLDGDDEPLENRRGRFTRRDLVQFVPFRDYEGKDPALLAAEVLEEVPRQVEVWGRLSKTAPSSFAS